MAATLAAPRYSAEDFETGSIRSAAPSYVSEVPSYHSSEAAPPYTPRERHNPSHGRSRSAQQQTIGLPPIPAVQPANVPNLHNFRIPNWSTRGAPAARQLHSVVERRVNAELSNSSSNSSRSSSTSSSSSSSSSVGGGGRVSRPAPDRVAESQYIIRPLEDPYLVGEEAAAKAKRDRLARERDDDVLQREDKQWDWLLSQMRTWEERERSWTRYRRGVEHGQRKNLLRRIGGRMM